MSSIFSFMILVIWFVIGVIGTITENDSRINYCMIIFLAAVPILPWIFASGN